ncbi:hypothetical protein EON81_03555 [bacterium]|nr:MAG: hypothetical protein EON81_03555 [bacterium]
MPRFRALALFAASALLPVLAPAQKVVAWGFNQYGQCDAPSNLVATQVAAGYTHSQALLPDGKVVAWGDANYDALSVPSGLVATQVSAGNNFSLALRPDGTLSRWGNNYFGSLVVPAGLTAMQASAGYSYILALRSNGTVAAWGTSYSGQTTVPEGLAGVQQMSAGGGHCAALRWDGSIVVWGDNSVGQRIVPAGLVATQLAAGGSHTLAVRTDDSVAAWGDNDYGQLGVPAGLLATQVAAGNDHSLALRVDGTVAAWGRNQYGQLNVPAGLTGVIQISTTGDHSLALVAASHCILNQKQVVAGGSATGTVKLAQPAPAGGTVVTLACDDPMVTVPATVLVRGGEVSKTFPVTTTGFFGPDRTAAIRTVYGLTESERRTVPFKLKVKGTQVALAFAAPVVGGSTSKPALTLTAGAPLAQDTVFSLASGAPEVMVPATVTLPAGKTSVKISLPATGRVSAPKAASVSTAYNGAEVATTNLTVNPLKATVSFDRPEVSGGDVAQGVLYLNAPVAQDLTVSLASGNPALSVPATTKVYAGVRAAVFPVSTSPVAVDTRASVTATLGGNAFSGNLRLTPTPAVKSLTLSASVYGQNRIAGTVRLNIAAKAGGTVVQLSSSDPSLSVPASVTVLEGQYAASFTATALDVAAAKNVVVTASNALGSASAGVAVNPLSVSSLILSYSTVVSGSSVSVTVALNVPVSVDTVVSLSSDNAGLVPVPATVVVPAGSRTATVSVTLGSTATAKNVKITATKHASSLQRTLKVTP